MMYAGRGQRAANMMGLSFRCIAMHTIECFLLSYTLLISQIRLYLNCILIVVEIFLED